MSAYYNEIDRFCAEWLRNLMKRGHIADGVVDERSIAEVQPEDVAEFAQCHFFAGIAGWSHALRLARWPDDRPVWTGSCPCQPFSAAGKQRGIRDERHLWPEFRRLIAQRRPPIIFGEQVASKLGRDWLAGVRADLEALGYAVGGADLCAASVGAPHIRQRLFWVADAEHAERRPICLNREDGRDGPHTGRQEAYSVAGTRSEVRGLADADEIRHYRSGTCCAGRNESADGSRMGDSRSARSRRDAGAVFGAQGEGESERSAARCVADQSVAASGFSRMGDTDSPRWCEQSERNGTAQQGQRPPRRADADGSNFWSDAHWLRCLDGKARRIEPGSFPLAHGVPARVGRLRAYGNAISPQIAQAFITAWMETMP